MSEAGEILGRLKLDASDFFAKLDEAQARAEELNGADPKIRVTTEGAGKAVAELEAVKVAEDKVESGTRKVAAAQKDGAKQAADWRGALVGSLVAVSAAAPPVAAAAVGITGAFGVMAGAGVLGVLGIVRGLQQGNAIGIQYKGTIDSLTASLHSAEDAAAGGLFPGVQASAQLLARDMPALNAEVGHFAGMLGAMLPTGLDATVTLLERANPLFDAAGRYLGGLVTGLDQWSHSTGYQDFLDYSIRSLPQVEHLLGDTGHLVIDFLKAWAPVGTETLPLLDGLVTSIDDLVKRTGPLVPATIAVVGAYKLLNPAIGWVRNLTAEVTALGDAEVVTAAKGKGLVPSTLSSLLPFLSKGGGAAASTGLGQSLALSGMGLAGGAALGGALAIGQSNDTFDASSQLLAQSSYTQGVAGRSGGAAGIDAALTKMARSGDGARAAAQFDQVRKAAAALGITTTALAADFPKYTAAVSGAGKASSGTAGSAKALSSALTAQTPITATLTAAQQAQVLAMRSVAEGFRSDMTAAELLGNTYDDVTVTQGALIASFQAQAKASKNGKVSLDENTVAGAQNAQQMRSAVDKIKAHADALNSDGKHAAEARAYTLQHAQSLETQATKAGADKGAVDRLIGSLVGVSRTHPVSKIDVQTAQAMSQLEALRSKLGNLNGYTAWVYVNLAGTAAGAAGTAGQVARNAVYGQADGGTIGMAGGGTVPGLAAGGSGYSGTVSGPGNAWNDMAGLFRLANGEEVISNKYGQASTWRPLLKAINAQTIRSPQQLAAMAPTPHQPTTVINRTIAPEIHVHNPVAVDPVTQAAEAAQYALAYAGLG